MEERPQCMGIRYEGDHAQIKNAVNVPQMGTSSMLQPLKKKQERRDFFGEYGKLEIASKIEIWKLKIIHVL